MTEKIYEHDSYCRSFSAIVESCTEEKSFYKVALNKTAFFPEGGGQAADSGTINGKKVLDVQMQDGIVWHMLSDPIPVGTEALCELDWDLRFSRMQSHTGEHIVSGVVYRLFGYQNVGFHMSEAIMTVDFDGALSQEQIEQIELQATQAIFENAPITVSYPAEEELKTLSFRSKTEHKDTRLVTIENVDCCACCAPHVARTGEVGMVKIISFCPYKKGTRIELLAGIHAYRDYMALHTHTKGMMGLLSASRYSVQEAVNKQYELVQELRAENQKLSRRLAMSEIQTVAVGESVYAISEGFSHDDMRACSNSLLEQGVKICILLSRAEGDDYLYVVSSATEDIRPIVQQLNANFSGKGGGRPNYAQGRLTASSEELKNMVEQILQA